MERRQIAGALGAGLFTSGGAALWASVNPTLYPTTALAISLGGTFCVATGLVVLGILFVTARSARAEEKKRIARREKIGAFLGESRNLLARARKAGADEAFVDEVQTWTNGMTEYVGKEFGASAIERLQHNRKGWRFAGGKDESEATPFLERVNASLGEMLDRLS